LYISIGTVENNLHAKPVVFDEHLYFIIKRNQLVEPRRKHYISGLAPQEQRHISQETAQFMTGGNQDENNTHP
jgi:hypothetical protein